MSKELLDEKKDVIKNDENTISPDTTDIKAEETKVENLESTTEIKDEVNIKSETTEDVKDNKKFNTVSAKEKREYDRIEKSQKKKKKFKSLKITIIFICILILLFAVFSTIFSLLNMNNENIISRVYIDGVDVSGLSKEDAINKLNETYKTKIETELIAQHGEYINNLNPTALEVNYNIEPVVEEALQLGRDNNIFVNNYTLLMSYFNDNNLDINMTLNEETLNSIIQEMNLAIPGLVVESSYVIEGNELVISQGQPGIIIDVESFKSEIKNALNDRNNMNFNLTIPVLNSEPAAIDIDKIYSEVYTEPKDAYYVKEPFEIFEEVEGINFDVEAARQILATPQDQYRIALTITKPAVTLSQIGSEAFPDQLATYTTRYDPTNINRTTNLRLAVQAINGVVLMPGETFSYNETLGPRTYARGYREAGIYSGGAVVNGLGGGICQVTTTLYNSVLMSDLEIVERVNHQFEAKYAPIGRDATVA